MDTNNKPNTDITSIVMQSPSEAFDQFKIDPYASYAAPPTILEVGGSPFGTLGNFSCVTGKAKSRKTFFLSLLCAALLDEENLRPEFKSHLNGKKILHLDTEQSDYHVSRVAKRVIKLVNHDLRIDIYTPYGLRAAVEDNLSIIESLIYNTENLGVVIIDGIADLINGYNDEEQASMIVKKLLKWSSECNCHIITVIHQNKGNNDAKGHLGSFILQKAETVLQIKKSNNNEISIVEPTHSRGMDINPISFAVNEEGLPYVVEYEATKKTVQKKLPNDYSLESNRSLARELFSEKNELHRAKLLELIRYQVSRCYSVDIGENKCRLWLTYFKEQKMILQSQNNGPYELNC